MKLTFNKPFMGLDGQPLSGDKDMPMNKLLSNLLAQSNSGDPLKLWDWAVKLNANDFLELDAADAQTLTEFVKASPVNNLVKAQLLREITKQCAT